MAKKSSTAMVNWESKLAEQAKAYAAQEAGVGTGDKFSIKGGILSFNDNPVKDNTMGVVILDTVLMNVNYPERYNPKNPSGPNCFAFGRTEAEMQPHKVCVDAGTAQAEECGSCPLNQWGSAETGRGKACGNKRRLALISGGEFGKDGAFKAYTDEAHFRDAGIGYLEIPPTALKGYAAFVKTLDATLHRPPHGIFTKVTVSGSTEDQVVVTFEPLAKVPDAIMGTIMERHEGARGLIEAPFPPYEGAKGGGRKGAPKANPRQSRPTVAPKPTFGGKAAKAAPKPAKATPAKAAAKTAPSGRTTKF